MGGIGSGGARDNAGRPPVDVVPREPLCLSLPPLLINNIRKAAEQKGVSMSQLVTDLLENKL